jgi:TetR/AcrR family transcriptional regulator, transcriptional repressor for nem operon
MRIANEMRSQKRLNRAMDLFWERGYYDVSVDELVNRTGLHRAAVYGQFGSRQRLFEATLRRYRETIVAEFFAELERPNAGLAEIRRFFLDISRAAARPKKRIGCLMINTTCEVSPNIRSVAHIVSGYLHELRALFRQACVNARARRDVRRGTDVEQVADYLLGSVLGLWTLARSPASTSAVQHYVQGVLMFVDGLRPNAADTRRTERKGTRRGPSRSGPAR